MRSEPILFGTALLITFVARTQSRVMVDKFWVEIPQKPLVITRSIKEPSYEAETEATRSPQNYIISPTKMSASEVLPRQNRNGVSYTSLRESFQNDVKNEKPRSAELYQTSTSTSSPEDNEDLCEPHQVRICENCLKITRAPQAYQQCCTNTNNAFSWCQRIFKYVNNQG